MIFRKILFIATMLMSTFAIAQNLETIPFNGQSQLHSELFAVKTHTEYRYEEQPDTCYRDVFSHYENVCRDIPEQQCSYEPRRTCRTISGACRTFQGQCRTHCHDVRGQRRCNTVCPPAQTRCEPDRQECSTSNERVCRTTYRTECNQVARYRSESYSCTRTVKIPYEVFDYNIEAKVDINVSSLPENFEINEELTIELINEEVSLKLSQNNASYVAIIKNQEKHESLNDQIKNIHFQIEIEIYKEEDIKKDIEGVFEKLSYENQYLIMTLKSTHIVGLESIHLNLSQDRFLIRNKAIFNDIIPTNKIEKTELNGKQILKVHIPTLVDNKLKSKKHHFSVNFNYSLGEGFITENKDLNLLIEKSFIQKI